VIYSSNGKGHASCVRCRVQSVGLYGLGVHSAIRWGWVFLEQTRNLSGIQFTRHLIELVVVETKIFFGNVNMILTRQTCGQRSSMSMGSKRQELRHYFSKRICLLFPMSKCRGDSNLVLCTFGVFA